MSLVWCDGVFVVVSEGSSERKVKTTQTGGVKDEREWSGVKWNEGRMKEVYCSTERLR
ncbi:MAG: hypothetical protein ABI729_03425 [Chitinophagales bacterium]